MSRAYLSASGVSGAERDRNLVRVGRDVWLPPERSALHHRDALRLLTLAAPGGSALSHETAIRWYGLPADRRRDHELPHITIPPGRNLHRAQLIVHVARLPIDDFVNHDRAQVTSPARTFLDLAGYRDRERLIVVGDAMLAGRLATRESLADRVGAASRVRGVVAARELVPLLDGRAQSPPESVLRLRFHDAGLPSPQLQYPIPLDWYTVHADLAWPEVKVALEYEGRQHAERDQFRLDVDRYSALAAIDWLVIRASARDLAGHSELLIKRTAAALTNRGLTW